MLVASHPLAFDLFDDLVARGVADTRAKAAVRLAEYHRQAGERFADGQQPAAQPAPPQSIAPTRAASAAAVQAERKHAAAIIGWCAAAGRPELTNRFIAIGASALQVRDALVRHLQDQDPVFLYRQEYARNRAAYQRAGMTEADYVSSRQADVEGLPFAK